MAFLIFFFDHDLCIFILVFSQTPCQLLQRKHSLPQKMLNNILHLNHYFLFLACKWFPRFIFLNPDEKGMSCSRLRRKIRQQYPLL